MPLEVVLLSPAILPVTDQREFAEILNPPIVARETCGGGSMTFTELDGEHVLTLSRPRRVETQTDIRRLLTSEGQLPQDTAYWYEGVIPTEADRGLVLIFAFEEAVRGRAIVRGVEL